MDTLLATVRQLTEPQRKILGSIGLSLFWVIFLWGFWTKGVYALGFNATAFGLLLFGFLGYFLIPKKLFQKENLLWTIPIFGMLSSFFLYQNYFLIGAHLLVIPVVVTLFFMRALLKPAQWDIGFLRAIVRQCLACIPAVRDVFEMLQKEFSKLSGYKSITGRVVLGLFLLFIVAFGVVIPLLASADETFALFIQDAVDWIIWLYETIPFFWQLVVTLLGTFLILMVLVGWGQKPEKIVHETPKRDPIIAGILLLGVLLLYMLFLGIQYQNFFLGNIMLGFDEIVSSVKSGFWQLVALSMLNIAFVMLFLHKSHAAIDRLVTLFIVSSVLLLLSAAQKMGFYVAFYGFSYEKFYASYTVLFCVFLFLGVLITQSQKKKIDVLRFTLTLFVVMYGAVSVFPAEHFIFYTNKALAQRPSSKVRLYELQMLSSDVLNTVEKHGELLEKDLNYYDAYDQIWKDWHTRRTLRLDERKWYEKTLLHLW